MSAGQGRSQCVAAGDSDLGARIANGNCRESEDALDVGRCVPTRGRRLDLGSMRIRNLWKLERQTVRAPTVKPEGWRPERPMPCAQLSTCGLVTRSGVDPTTPKKCWSMRL